MKRFTCTVLVVLMLISCVLSGGFTLSAAEKAGQSRAVAIVFDNSGSMYINGEQAWCRATYAMEVFGSMLNKGDTLLIYPMHPITVGGAQYTMDNPFKITDSSKASQIRDILTDKAGGTPIESVDAAVKGLQGVSADKKYMIVLTDGDSFYLGGSEMSKEKTKSELDKRFQANAGKNMTVMYLGIGKDVVMPDTPESEYFAKKKAENSADVLSSLTDMCNRIFGRDTLPKSYLTGKTVNFDISMSKLIVFVQGENVSGLKVTNASGPAGELQGSTSTKYGTAGAGNYDSVPDTTLQGMMVTYTGCPAGEYNIEYTGNASSVEAYYEPDADLEFVFTDSKGNKVDPNALYEGEYKMSFGMKDGRTGELISSELLGKPHYQGSYFINGQEYPIAHDGHSGEVPITLNMDDTFEANLTVTYLSGYTISKDSTDFGWPEGGIKVSARPAGELTLEITGGDELYSLQHLEEGTPYTAKVFYQGEQLTGAELEKVELKWDPDTSNAEIKQSCEGDHYNLYLCYKDPESPKDTVCGPCTVDIYAYYAAKGSSQAQAQCSMTYNIEDDFSPLEVDLVIEEDYFVVSEMKDEHKTATVKLSLNGQPLSAEEFESVALDVDCGGIEYELTPDPENSAYKIEFLPTDGLKEGDYDIKVNAEYTDSIGRTTETKDSSSVTVSNMPMWLKWLIGILILLLIILIIIIILHIKVLPKSAHITKKDSTFIFDGEDETKSTTFDCSMNKGSLRIQSKYGGTKTGLSMDVKPGKDSYLRKPKVRRSAEVKSTSVKKYGNATIQEATIGSVKYVLNEANGKLERVPMTDKAYNLRHNTMVKYSGTMLNAGVPKPFSVTTKLNFKKK